MKKYSMVPEGAMFRIVAEVNLPRLGVTRGDKGGLISRETNLSHEDNAWVFDNAQVSGNARVIKGRHNGCVVHMNLSRHGITVDGSYIIIGCKSHRIKTWLKYYEKIGKLEGYTEKEIQEYGAALKFISEVYFKESKV